MSPRVQTSDFRVRYAETDRMGVVYHANYLVWCEVGRTDYIRGVGVSYAELEAQGLMLAVADASIRYHAPARYDDMIRVETTLSELRSRTITFEYLITNAATGSRLVSARTTLVSLDADGRTVSLPPDFRRMLEASLA
ncbi:MAG TPA: thioesterase family protein [Gemmatimonadaceae bacterium]|nr:thioesterase family protein [Gemmatimonadaceae bacterium]